MIELNGPCFIAISNYERDIESLRNPMMSHYDSHDFPMVPWISPFFPWWFHVFPLIFPWCRIMIPMIFAWFSSFSHDFHMNFTCFSSYSHVFPNIPMFFTMIFPLFPCFFPWFSMIFHVFFTMIFPLFFPAPTFRPSPGHPKTEPRRLLWHRSQGASDELLPWDAHPRLPRWRHVGTKRICGTLPWVI